MIYAELAAATNFSFLRGASHPDEMVLQAKALGLGAIGVADRNSLAGVVRAHRAAKEASIRLLVGARIVTRCGFEAIAYPVDRAAYGRLCRLLTLGNRRAPKGGCFIDLADLADHAAGLALIACEAGSGGADALAALKRRLPDPALLFLALTRRFAGADMAEMIATRACARQLGLTCLAVQDALYHAPERRPLADVLTCIRTHVTIDAAGRALAANAERHLKPPAEMARLFAGFEDAIAAQDQVLARVNFSLDELRYEYPDEVVHPGETAMQSLERLTWAGAARRYPDGVPAAVARVVRHEFGLIAELDYAKYFLTVREIVAFADSQGILAQGRGSAANSAVCYCLGITAVDPTKVDLLFERFVSPERREPPDIDVDFEHERREEVIQHIYETYGRERAGLAATVITYRGKSAIREVGKALALSADTIEALSRTLWGWSTGGPKDDHVRAELGLDPDNPRLRLALDLTQQLVGFPRHLSQHVGGFVITRGPLEELVPIGNAAMADRTFIEWDKDDIDALGILKIDILALGMLTAVARAFAMIETHYGRRLCLASVPAEDPAVYDMICEADTVGVFQIESRAQMSMLPRLKPRCFYDLVIEVAIVRPGPIQGDMVHPYLRRRQGLETVSFPSVELEQVLGKTLGVPLFQEQAMRIAIVAAGFTPGEADRLRRAMATFRKVGTIHTFQQKLVEGMAARGYDRAFAERCFKQIEGFGEYGFPESHAASFALIVYVSAWLKKHYPAVFCAALLNAQPMGFYAPAQLVRDAREHGVTVREIDVNFSDWDNNLEDEAVRLGLRQISGFSEAEAAKIVAARAAGGRFASVEDVRRRARLSPAALERLAHADAFRSLGADRRRALWEAKALRGEDAPLFQALSDFGPEVDPALPEMALCEHVAHDYARLKLSLKAHPMAFLRSALASPRARRAADLVAVASGAWISLSGLVLVRQRPGSAKGVIFMTLEDETGAANVIVWPAAFARHRRIVLTGRLLEVQGRLQKQGKVIHLIAERLIDHTGLLARLTDGDVDFGEAGMARADEVRSGITTEARTLSEVRRATLSYRAQEILPNSRDFH
ncbi:MAG: error-prone DNA polymerase [Caulobacterales bacterium]